MKNLLTPEKSTFSKIRNVGFTYLLTVAWIFFISMVLYWITRENKNFQVYNWKAYLFYACFMAPLWEELAFRYIPITIAKTVNKDLIVPVMFLSSLIFGWGHGKGTESLLVQGVGGLILCWLYIKNNYSYWSTVAVHAMWNLSAPFFPF